MEEEYDYEFEMPVRCECGNWFDLNDGFESKKGVTICSKCHSSEKDQKRIDALEQLISDAENEVFEFYETIEECKNAIISTRSRIEWYYSELHKLYEKL